MLFQKINLKKSEARKKFIQLIICLLFTLLSCLFLNPNISTAKDIFSPEYIIKAAFIYNFAKFIEWPSFISISPYFTICILGKDPFGETIDEISGKTIGSRQVRIKRIKSIDELQKIRDCQILFISQSEKKNISWIIHRINRQPILTITDHPDSVQLGVIINFVVIDEKVRFEINNNAALKAGIKISSKLLRLSTNIVE